jgi:FkbM family methyltransferase
MEDAFEAVVAENRELRKDIERLRARVAAFESSRWWRLHPRNQLRNLRRSHHEPKPPSSPAQVRRVARSWRLKTEYQRRSIEREPDEVVVREEVRVRVHPDSRWPFEEFCFHAPEQVDELDSFLTNTSDCERLLDVGARDGVFSLVFVANHPNRQALAIDASPLPFARLLYNIHRNGADNVVPIERALSNEAGFLEMRYMGEFAVAGTEADGSMSIRVKKETGDAVCERYAFEPDVVKIDVEGHELRVVQGLRNTLRTKRPLLFLEIHPQFIAATAENGTQEELVRELRSLGYERAEVNGERVPVGDVPNLIHHEVERLLFWPA